jgi:hypothetical protein
MAQSTDSFKAFDYSLRPSKQVERKAIVEVLLSLARVGYHVPDYSYLGFGSVYYVDFVMFHKYLFINKMVCVEWGDIERRMKFNKPYKFIKLKLMPLSNYIPSIPSTQKLLVWLDYDRSLDADMLRDIDGMCARLSPQSIFLITMDARPKLPRDLFDVDKTDSRKREQITWETYQDWFGTYLDSKVEKDIGSRTHAAQMFYEATVERLRRTLQIRGLKFIQFFNFFYRDGAPMLTIGGMIGSIDDQVLLQDEQVKGHKFVRTAEDYLTISVPPLTAREKHWLDSRLYGKIKKEKVAFELDQEMLENYCHFYKQYPNYLEALL